MGIVDRVKNILLTPKTEWPVIAGEPTPTAKLITGYVLPLAALAAIATFIGSVVVGTSLGPLGTFRTPIVWGIVALVLQLVMAVVSVFVIGFIIDALAPTFQATKNSAQALKVAVYACTPMWVAGVLNIIPMLGLLAILGGLYAIYLMYLGLPALMKNPPDKSAGYTAVVVIASIVVMVILGVVTSLITAPAYLGAAAAGARGSVEFDKDSAAAKLEAFGKQMEAAGKKMEDAKGDPNKSAEAAMGAVGAMLAGGKKVEPLSVDEVKAFVPESFVGLPRTASNAARENMGVMTVTKAEATYGDASGKEVRLSVTDAGGASALLGLFGWAGVGSERDDANETERTRKEGGRTVHERISKKGGDNEYAVILADRFVVNAEGSADIAALRSAVGALNLAKLESLKDKGVQAN